MHVVIQTVDCLRSLSVLWKALASKQDLVEKLDYVYTEVEVVIIVSLLLLSGDIEENPGPLGGILYR